MISLVMLSGGIDSTYALCKVLAETNDEVLVHHVHLLTDSGRHIPEAAACLRIIEYCRSRYRPFHYSESGIDHRRFVSVGYDMIAVGLEAGMVASSYYQVMGKSQYINRWIVGLSADDTLPEHRLNSAGRVALFNSMLDQEKKPEVFVFPRVSLREQVAFMPKELLDLTWSCRFPRGLPDNVRPCGECISCKRRAAALVAEREEVGPSILPERTHD
jgi:hypothetical protein